MNQLTINPESEKNRIVNFLKQTFAEQKINKAVIGLSGGLDSMTAFYLLLETLPPKNIFAYHLPYEKENITVKKTLEKLNFPMKNYQIISIKKVVEHFWEENRDRIHKIRLGNIISRTRMIILFDRTKKHNALVCGTENKSEHLLGYFTRFGDSASDIEPIQHLYKTQVHQLAKYLKIPNEILIQSPTAGLWKGQTDEEELGFTYQEADQVLYLYFDKKLLSVEIIKKGFVNTQKIINRVKKNEFKSKTPYTAALHRKGPRQEI